LGNVSSFTKAIRRVWRGSALREQARRLDDTIPNEVKLLP